MTYVLRWAISEDSAIIPTEKKYVSQNSTTFAMFIN